MIYGSVCSGIEAATVAWHPLGWTPKFFSEIEKFPSRVLAHHYGSNMPGEPLAKNGIPNHGDFTKIEGSAGPVDLLVGGTPCQSFSVAGKRLGLDDPRGNLALEYLALAKRLGARWIVWENVFGVLSSRSDDGTSDFATFLNFVRQCGYGFAYRILDAQFTRADGYETAVPQRRRRVFLVGYLGDWRIAAAVLFDPEGLRGDPPPRRQAGQGSAENALRSADERGDEGPPASLTHDVAPALVSSGGGVERGGDTRGQDPVIAVRTDGLICADVASTLNAAFGDKQGLEDQHINSGAPLFVAHALRGEGFDASEDGTGRGTPIVPVCFNPREDPEVTYDRTGPLGSSSPQAQAVEFDMRGRDGGAQMEGPHHTANIRAASGGSSRSYVAQAIDDGGNYACKTETDTFEALCLLRDAIGAEAFAEWRFGILDSFQSSEILRPEMHGKGIRCETDEGRGRMDDWSLPRETGSADGAVPRLREDGRERRSPQGWELPKQLIGKLSEALSKLPYEGSQAKTFLQDLRRASEGSGILQQALPAIQRGEDWAVRRLTPRECERLMGFQWQCDSSLPGAWQDSAGRWWSPDYTAIPDSNGKPAADGPRYKALGNSMAVNVMRAIGQRIDLMETLIQAGTIKPEGGNV